MMKSPFGKFLISMALVAAVLTAVNIHKLKKTPVIVPLPATEKNLPQDPSLSPDVGVPLESTTAVTKETPRPKPLPARPLPTPLKDPRQQIISENDYELLKRPYAGAIAFKLKNGKTVINTVSEVTPYGCPAPYKKKMCLSFPGGEQIVVSPELAPQLPRNFKYYINHF